jgi:IMP dehydrogenase/GMP reductase
MKIENDIKLDFSDVLIRPKRSTLSSRNEVNVEREFTFKYSNKKWRGVPIMVANMDTTGTIEMARELSKFKIITCLHKFYSADDIPDDLDRDYYAVSTGINEADLQRLDTIINKVNPEFICIDVANGYSHKFLEVCTLLRKKYPTKTLIGGNVVTREMVEELSLNGGLDIIKCGIGSGCFSSDTKILMADGTYKNINTINVGEYVINMNGSKVMVKNVLHQGKKNVVKIKTTNWNGYTFVTPDHNYFIDNKWQSISSIELNNQLYLPESIQIDSQFSNSNIGTKVPFNFEWGYLFGCCLVFGKNKSKTVDYLWQTTDEYIANNIKDIIWDTFQYDCFIYHNAGLFNILCYNIEINKILQSIIIDKLPTEFYNKTPKYVNGLLTLLTYSGNPQFDNLKNWCNLVLNPNKLIEIEPQSEMIDTWDLEIDCDTHSFIANNSVVHNSVCTTRLLTGVGCPQLSTVMECSDAAHGIGTHIISDGGIVHIGDISKAIGAGADFVMMGSMFSGHEESGGELVEENGKKYKYFYGMSSSKAMDQYHGGVANYRSSEGKVTKIPYKGLVQNTVLDILGGIRSTMTYIGAHNIKDMSKCTTFIRVNNVVNTSLKQYEENYSTRK